MFTGSREATDTHPRRMSFEMSIKNVLGQPKGDTPRNSVPTKQGGDPPSTSLSLSSSAMKVGVVVTGI